MMTEGFKVLDCKSTDYIFVGSNPTHLIGVILVYFWEDSLVG